MKDRYDRTLENGSIMLERLQPGPLEDINLPEEKNGIMLSLYYRWALQFLSALSFLHSHGVYVISFSDGLVWLRSDLSLAITGFISNRIKGVQEEDWGENGGYVGIGSESFPEYSEHYHIRTGNGGVRQDLHNWAGWLYELIATEAEKSQTYQGVEKEGVSLSGRTEFGPITKKEWILECKRLQKQEHERYGNFLLENLGEERLGSVFNKIWNSEYTNAEDVAEDVRRCAEKAGIKIVGKDEVDIGYPWENAFVIEADQYYQWDDRRTYGSDAQERYWERKRLAIKQWPKAEELAALFDKGKASEEYGELSWVHLPDS